MIDPNDYLVLAHKASCHSDDVRPVTRAVPDIVRNGDAAAARDLLCAFSLNRDAWLPEALALFNTPGLTPAQTQAMSDAVMPGAGPLAECNARLGSYGFSFPQWRYLTQSFNGASLVERFGMERLKRETDTPNPSLPDPQRDLFGAGFIWRKDDMYIEYRRAYVVCSDASEENAATLVIRNNSYFFGRDRLPDPVYVSWKPVPADDLQALTPQSFDTFTRWQDSVGAAPEIPLPEKARRVSRLLDTLDAFDARLSVWLRTPEDGLEHLTAFLRHKLPGPVPFIAEIENRMPPWFPKFSAPLTQELVERLETGKSLEPARLELLFNPLSGAKMVLLTGEKGDLPLGRSPVPQLRK